MRVSVGCLFALLSPLATVVTASRIVLSNDDGWAESNVRSFYTALKGSRHEVVLSCPAENKSGTGPVDFPPQPRSQPCQYNSCPANSGPTGADKTDPALNWVNSFPVTSMEYGISKVAPRLWSNQAPEFAVAGPNVGSNVWGSVYFSGTVGATVHAVRQHKIPAIAFSGTSDERASFETKPTPIRSLVYAELATELTNVILESGKPYLPANVWLNVNFPKVEGACTKASDFKWVMTRINPPIPIIHWDEDTEICGSKNLPTEFDVMNRNDCYIAVTAGDALDKTTGSAEQQELVYQKLKSILTCLPK